MTTATEAWLGKAQEDLGAVAVLLDDASLTNIAAFHAQQCIEKSFKAVLESAGKPVPRIHDLIRLSALVAETAVCPADDHALIELSTIYLDARYPVATGFLPAGKPDLHDVKRYFNVAEAVFHWALAQGNK